MMLNNGGRPSPGPLSPLSMNGSEWSGIGRYQNFDDSAPASPGGPNARGNLVSPPVSSGSSTKNMSISSQYPPRGLTDNPSPPASVAGRSSLGTPLYSDSGSQGGRNEAFEPTLARHYDILKRFLAASLRDETGNIKPNRARDKLLRLSPVQFQELSTDVFDELQRRQAKSRRPSAAGPPNNEVPDFLPPKTTFHPKRNQARQKLSTLPHPRFRDLATDVFYELERRFPHFSGPDINRNGSPASSMRGPPSRTGTPADGMRPGSRGKPGTRRPSNASSIASAYPRSSSRQGSRGNLPPMALDSPGLPPNDYSRPQAKTFQSNTIVPNKSTMVEEDDESGAEDEEGESAYNLEGPAALNRASKRSNATSRSGGGSETDKKLIEVYQTQVAELRAKLDAMEDTLRHQDGELVQALERRENQSSDSAQKEEELADLRRELEEKEANYKELNNSLEAELDRVRAEQDEMERSLRAEIEELKVSGAGNGSGSNAELERENEELRQDLREQQQITDDVRREAQEFLREMRMLSERSGTSAVREEELTNQIERLEAEVTDWRNRYARTKTQLRNLRTASIGLTIQQDTAKYFKDNGFTNESGMVKDVHVTKFQISIDELLRVARSEEPARVVDYMKNVVVNVRNIIKDIEESQAGSGSEDLSPQQSKLKSRVSATANNLITASKNFASSHGISPVSLLDAAASHLTAAVVELIRTVKIRPTPAGELEDDDDGSLPAVDATGYFSGRNSLSHQTRRSIGSGSGLFGTGNGRPAVLSTNSSMYSPVNSPRDSAVNHRPRSSRDSVVVENGYNSINGMNGISKAMAPMGTGFGIRTQESDVEELKIYLEDQTAVLVQTIQSLVSCIRSDSGVTAITNQISAIADVVGIVVTSTETTMSSTANSELRTQGEPIVRKLANCRQRLVEAREQGRKIADKEEDDDTEWRQWTQGLPPIAFEIARETKELVQRVDAIDAGANGGGDDDYS